MPHHSIFFRRARLTTIGLRTVAVGLLLAALIGIESILPPSAAQENMGPTGGRPWDLRNVTQPGLFAFYDTPAGASLTGKPLDIGDFDGNGCGDIAITGQNASFGIAEGWRSQAGHVRIVMNMCEIEGRIALEDNAEPSRIVLTVYGARAGDMAGTETHVADFNGDGYDDLLLSAQNSDGTDSDRPNAGGVYLALGGSGFASRGDIDLRQPADGVFSFYGADAEDRFGIWVGGGDFDGDGFTDMLIGANQADGENDARTNAGEVWILYGAAELAQRYDHVTDMRQPPAEATRIIGADYDDLLGSCNWGDDLNGDGYDDAIVSAALWRGSAGVEGLSFGGGDGPGNQRYNSGEVFVVFGSPGLPGQTFDLAAHIDNSGHPLDETLTVIYGVDANDVLGEEIATGDLDGDHRSDLVVGTLIGDGPNNRWEDAGEAWVIYTHDPFVGQMFDLATPDTARTVVIYPDQPFSSGGDTARVADLDNDGLGDLVYGAPNYDAIGYDLQPRRNAGLLAVIFGEIGGLPNTTGGQMILPAQVPEGARVRYIVGADENDMMAYAMAVYDVDSDAYIDIAPNGMGGDGAYNTQPNAGEIYVISGAEFLSPGHEYGSNIELTSPAPTAGIPPTPTSAFDTSVPGNAARGEDYYRQSCAGCHDPTGGGEGVGVPLVDSPFVLNATDAELLDFLRVGRSADDPDNVTGVTMPAYGGRPDWEDEQLWDVIAYLRQLTGQR
jgi:mono/diheme cytochrome c family protein